jgi:hypothetical protein
MIIYLYKNMDDIYYSTKKLPCYFCQTPTYIIACFSIKKRMCINCVNECIIKKYINPKTGEWYIDV